MDKMDASFLFGELGKIIFTARRVLPDELFQQFQNIMQYTANIADPMIPLKKDENNGI